MSSQTAAAVRGPQTVRKSVIAPTVILLAAIVVVAVTGAEFRQLQMRDPIVPGPGVTRQGWLSDYHAPLAGTPMETPVYFLEGSQRGGTILVLGGTHGNEIAGRLAAVILVENAVVDVGRVIVIPETNASALTHTAPNQAVPAYVTIKTPWGERRFRHGDRLSNPLHQYPDPEVHIHYPSGHLGAGQEARNLNRVYPGRPDGTLTEQLAYAIIELVRREQVDLVLDMHEARPMNPIVQALVVHERAMDVGAWSVMELQAFEGVSLRLEPSPVALRGLSHREIGDATQALATLSETPNIAMDWLRGPTDERLVIEGRDEFMSKAARRPGLVYVNYDHEKGLHINDRTGTHLSTFLSLAETYSSFYPDRPVVVRNVPRHADVMKNGVGVYLRQP